MSSLPPDRGSAPDSDPDPLIGTLIGDRYRIESVLGRGGMGTVYQAEHVLMEKRVALKVLHPSLAVVSSVMDRFQREAIALSRIEHPNVVSASDFGKLKNGSFYLALQFVEGRNLAEVLETDSALPVVRALSIALQTARALAAAHKDNIVHRDLKPHNIMLTHSATEVDLVKVLDFGLAKLRSKTVEGSTVNIGSVFGTPHYMAPEQITGIDVDARADLYSLGVILYEMLEGRRPFNGPSPREVLDLQVSQPPPPMSDAVPMPVRKLVDALLQKSRDQRPQSAEELVGGLELLLSPAPPATGPMVWLREPYVGLGPAIPRWVLGLPLAIFLLIFFAGRWLTSHDPGAVQAASPSQAVTPHPAAVAGTNDPSPGPPDPARWPQLFASAEFGEPSALEELLRIPPAERSVEIWRVIGLGQLKGKRPSDGLELYQQAIAHKPELANDEQIALSVRQMASDPRVASLAVTVAAESLGSRGVDILFSVWADSSKRTPASALAQRYLDETRIQQKASNSVKLALALRDDTSDCQAMRTLVTNALEYGDNRAARPMARLRLTKGCGDRNARDCYPCLRGDKLLENALRHASKQPAPKY